MLRRILNRPFTEGCRAFCSSESTELLVKERTIDNHIALISINRYEKRNCVNPATALRLLDAFERFEEDSRLKVAVLYGEGDTFCAGFDLTALATSEGQDMTYLDVMVDKQARPMGPSMLRFAKPVLAAVEGYAVAGGLELALMCDMRIAAEDAVFGVFCRRFGVPLLDGGSIRLPHLIGLSRAMDLILTGRAVKAAEAHSMGLVNRVVPKGSAVERAVELAKQIASFPEECMLADRRSAYHAVYDARSYEEAFDYEWQNGYPVIDAEARAGAQRFHGGEGRHGVFPKYRIE